MKVLITGGAGFIGSHTADRLLKMGHEVRILDCLTKPVHPESRRPEYLDSRIEFMEGDVTNKGHLFKALEGVDVVYHLAAFQDYLPQFSKFVDVNIKSTTLLYELICEWKEPIKKVIVASSQAALGEGLYIDAIGNQLQPDMRLEEDLRAGRWEPRCPEGYEGPLVWAPTDETKTNPQNPYGMSKISQEMFALSLGKRYNIPTVALRYSIVQGSRQSFYNAYSGACRIFSLAFYQGKEPPIYEDGNQIRDFINIHDVVDANILVLEDDRANYEMFNVGGGVPVTVKDFAKVVADAYGYTDYKPDGCGKYRFGDTRHIFSNINKLRNLGWEPKRTIKDSVLEYKEWLDTAECVDDIVEYCSKKMQDLNVVRSIND
jgi:dTDP-L-rhamnose 4-epimerase|tara:strand:+ start:4137 stop:5258 length:1122 start_codon:yes stop_codon:yes gene_type:complete